METKKFKPKPALNQNNIDLLKKEVESLQKRDFTPDKHDGSYELVRETINKYGELNDNDFKKIDYNDLNLIYLMCKDTRKQSVEIKKVLIQKSNLNQKAKEDLILTLDRIWDKAQKGQYNNDNCKNFGMFNPVRYFRNGANKNLIQKFVKLCVDIEKSKDDDIAFKICDGILNDQNFKIEGMSAPSASIILHCLKPEVFPIFKRYFEKNTFEYLNVKLTDPDKLYNYINNVKQIREYVDKKNFKVKNYRVFDFAALKIFQELNGAGAISDDDDFIEEELAKNMILYGPPGTGKTYSTTIYAVAICDDKNLSELTDYSAVLKRFEELKSQGRIAFTTFHQSYGYEEFIEGIEPVINGTDDENYELAYRYKSGVFKEFCQKSEMTSLTEKLNELTNDNPKVWKVSLEGTGDNLTRRECMQNSHIRIGWDSYGPGMEKTGGDKYEGKDNLNRFYNKMRLGDIVLSCYSQTTIDAIGVITGDADWDNNFEKYKRVRNVEWIVKDKEMNILSLNGGKNLTLSTIYKLSIDQDDVINFLNNPSEEDKPYVFIIDEINRGNISKIFGELITLIEPSKRKGMPEAMEAILPYTKKPFSVPKNVYIIGTMNTADRSIALMDTALRRRFQFVEMMPDAEVLRKIGADKVDDLDVTAMLDVINKRIEFLYDREHTIGHAFFTGLKDNPTIENLANIFEKSILPLLQEYFYDDYEKIRLVLGDNAKDDDKYVFIKKLDDNPNNIFRGDVSDFDLPDCRYEINKDAFNELESYKQIMG